MMDERRAVKYHDRLVSALREAVEQIGAPYSDDRRYSERELQQWDRWWGLLAELDADR